MVGIVVVARVVEEEVLLALLVLSDRFFLFLVELSLFPLIYLCLVDHAVTVVI